MSHDNRVENKTGTQQETRRSMLRKLGSAGVGLTTATSGLVVGSREAKGMIVIRPGDVYSERVETLCDLAPHGLTVWAAAALTDPIPGDAVYLGIAAAGAHAGCAVRDEFVEHFPKSEFVDVTRANKPNGNGKKEILVTPREEYDGPIILSKDPSDNSSDGA